MQTKYKCSIAFLVSGLLLVSASARADWQYTKWGMTPQEVAAASGGTVHVSTPTADELKSDSINLTECAGSYTAGAFKFIAWFDFDREKHGLREVTLLFVAGSSDGGTTSDLLQAMQEKYGTWAPNIVWIDNMANYSVTFHAMCYSDPHCDVAFINYKPLHAAAKKGL
jgi:hypothetical protein